MSDGYLRIGEFSERVGVNPDLLRAWERRYGLVCPDRSEGGFRLYSDADVARVRRMAAHLGDGLSAAQAARLALDATGPGSGEAAVGIDVASGVVRLGAALRAFDDTAAHEVVDGLLVVYPLETVLREAVLPCLAELGAGWAAGEVTVAQEHFASNLLRGRLLGLARGWDAGAGPVAVLAAPPGEDHDLALLVLGLALGRRGWRVTFLGADTPWVDLLDAVDRVAPRLVVLSAIHPDALAGAADPLGRLPDGVVLVVGGPGTSAALAERLGAHHLATDPVTAAAQLSPSGPTVGRTAPSA